MEIRKKGKLELFFSFFRKYLIYSQARSIYASCGRKSGIQASLSAKLSLY